MDNTKKTKCLKSRPLFNGEWICDVTQIGIEDADCENCNKRKTQEEEMIRKVKPIPIAECLLPIFESLSKKDQRQILKDVKRIKK